MVQSRVLLVDRLRGLMIVLMVLDHVREFTHREALLFQPNDLAHTTPALFATRWVTHLCAPTFVFLAGVSVHLQQARGKTGWALSRFLVLRGLWLIALELTLVAFGFDFGWPFLLLQVIWAIGLGMILLAPLVALPANVSLVLGIALVAGHQAFAQYAAAMGWDHGLAWALAFRPTPLTDPPGLIAYPLIPWFGVLAAGYGAGRLFDAPADLLSRRLLVVAAGLLALFVLVRALDGYGDPSRWSVQATGVFTALSFLNISKYPPSLLYVLATLGTALAIGAALPRLRGAAAHLLDSFGRTPLFTYMLHIYFAHLLALAIGLAQGLPAADFSDFLRDPARLKAAGWGISLVGVYVCWATVVLALWAPAAWFAGYRARHRHWWLSYL